MNNIIEVNNLKRIYNTGNGPIVALNGINFNIKKGEIFGLLGPNGAGKTTTIKILTTMLAPTSGYAKILGFDCFTEAKNVRKRINFVFGGEKGLYPRLSALDNLYYFADLYNISYLERKRKAFDLLNLVGLMKFKNRKVELFSKGMKQRLQIARALINSPEIVFFDEPSIGLDPEGARDLRNIIRELSSMGKTILLTSHYLGEIEELCDRVTIIKSGKNLATGTMRNFIDLIPVKRREELIKRKKELQQIKKADINLSLEDIYLEIIKGDKK